jgi:hypothetical protein
VSRRVVHSAGLGTAFTCPTPWITRLAALSTLPTTPTTTASLSRSTTHRTWNVTLFLLISDAVSGDRFLLEPGFLTFFFVIK